ncbi:hypothetical protein BJX76DRAFT_288563 [Aspergillus varians]
MDVDPPASRDPRLANRGSRLSQHEVQQPPLPSGLRQRSVPDAQYDAPGDQFIRGLAELVQTAVSTATDKSEREKFQKKRGTTEDLLRRAKAQNGFPSTLEFLHNARNDEDRVLASIDEKIKNHEAHQQRLFDDLRTRWAASTTARPLKSEDKVPQLQQSLESATARLSSLQGVVAQLTSRGVSVDNELKNLQEALGNQQKSFGNHIISCALIQKDMDEQKKDVNAHSTRLKQLEESAKQPVDGITTDTKKALDHISAQYKNLEQKTAKYGQDIGFLSSSYQRISKLPDQINRSLNDQQQKLENSQTLNSKLDNAVLSLNHKIQELQNIQSTKDDLLLADMEDLRNNLRRTDQAQERLTESVQDTLLKTPREPLDPKVDALLAEVRRWHSMLEPINVALHSLESRYNNLSTEPIVQHMVGAMQEMYPSVDQIWRELQGQKRSLEQELPLLRKKIEQVEVQGGTSTLSQGVLDSIRAEQAGLSRTIGTVLERYQWLSQEEFRGMQAHLESLAEKQTLTTTVIQQKHSADEELLQELKGERDSLNSRLTSLHHAFEKLNSEYTQQRSNAPNHEDMGALEVRITELEKSAVHSYEKLKVKKRVQLPDTPSGSGFSQRESTPKTQIPPPPRPDLLDGPLGMRIKRPHASSHYSDDEISPAPSNSPRSLDSTIPQTVPPGEAKKKEKKKKKKRRVEGEAQVQAQAQAQAPIHIVD